LSAGSDSAPYVPKIKLRLGWPGKFDLEYQKTVRNFIFVMDMEGYENFQTANSQNSCKFILGISQNFIEMRTSQRKKK
jgi:hypothetical protein